MHIIEMLPLVLLCVTSYSFLNLYQFRAWNGAKAWQSSRFGPSPLSRSGSRSQAVSDPHHACMWASVTTVPSTHPHRRSHTSTERPSVFYPKVELEAFIFQGKIDPVSFFFALWPPGGINSTLLLEVLPILLVYCLVWFFSPSALDQD